jgi:hypothetical protein
MGQIGGTMLYATSRVRAQVLIGMAQMAASIVVTYLVLAPADAAIPGFYMGSVGLAGKMVTLQFVAVNCVAFYLAKSLQMTFDWVYQPISGLGCIGAGLLAYAIQHWVFEASANIWLEIVFFCFLYCTMVFSIIWWMPSLAGVSRDEIKLVVRRVIPIGLYGSMR